VCVWPRRYIQYLHDDCASPDETVAIHESPGASQAKIPRQSVTGTSSSSAPESDLVDPAGGRADTECRIDRERAVPSQTLTWYGFVKRARWETGLSMTPSWDCLCIALVMCSFRV